MQLSLFPDEPKPKTFRITESSIVRNVWVHYVSAFDEDEALEKLSNGNTKHTYNYTHSENEEITIDDIEIVEDEELD